MERAKRARKVTGAGSLGGGGASDNKVGPSETGRQVANLDQGQKKARRAAAGTAAAAAEAMQQAAAGWPAAPSTLRPSERGIWLSIMVARLPAQWAQVDLLHAANLARTLGDIEQNRKALLREGSMVKTPAGPKVNPRHGLVETLSRRAIALTRVLQLHAVATIGPKGKQAGSKAEAEGAAGALTGKNPQKPTGPFNPDELLASPTRLQ